MFFARHRTCPKCADAFVRKRVLCEGSCTVAGYDRAVNIGKLEAFCTDWQSASRRLSDIISIAPPTGRRVAVVGSGPAGMSVGGRVDARRARRLSCMKNGPSRAA